MSSPCRMCGACCRAISLDQSKAALRRLAVQEAAHLARAPHHPHRRDILRLVEDVRFIRRHFRRISRAQAVAHNPAFADAAFDGRAFYTCDCLTSSGRCARHATRPYLCEGYPWYHSAKSRALLAVTPCGYEAEVMAESEKGARIMSATGGPALYTGATRERPVGTGMLPAPTR